MVCVRGLHNFALVRQGGSCPCQCWWPPCLPCLWLTRRVSPRLPELQLLPTPPWCLLASFAVLTSSCTLEVVTDTAAYCRTLHTVKKVLPFVLSLRGALALGSSLEWDHSACSIFVHPHTIHKIACIRHKACNLSIWSVSRVLNVDFMWQIVSTMATTSLEGVAAASQGSPLIIFQLYVQRDRDFTASLIRSKVIGVMLASF